MAADEPPKQTGLQGIDPPNLWVFDRHLGRDEVDRLYEASKRSRSEVRRLATMMGGRPAMTRAELLDTTGTGEGASS